MNTGKFDSMGVFSIDATAQLLTYVFDPSPCSFPKPGFPLLPQGFDGIRLRKRSSDRCAPLPAMTRHFSRGRYALHEAYRLAGVSSYGALLAPAYHCRTMVDPALALGASVRLYSLQEDLSPDLADIERLIGGGHQIKALLATHFFGFPKDFAAVKALCASRGITFVEDCSHALFLADRRASGVGSFGDFVVSSPYKFLPCPDGGLLYSPQRNEPARESTQGLAIEVRAVFRLLRYQFLRPGNARFDLATSLDNAIRRAATSGYETCRPEPYSRDYRPDEAYRLPLRLSRVLQRHADVDEIRGRRQHNYSQWVERLKGIPNCRPLFPSISADGIPYMFPLVIDRPQPDFSILKHMGLPIWRWDSIVASQCPTANLYRLRLIHLPCHQSLTETDLESMAAIVTTVMTSDTDSLVTSRGSYAQ